jgi:phytoene dehydrogenase-like protein
MMAHQDSQYGETIRASRAPAGRAIARIQLLDVPTRPRGDAAGQISVADGEWTDAVKERFADRVIDIVGRHLPNVPGAILRRAILSPREIASFNPSSGHGVPYGGTHDLGQSYLLRPLAAAPSHATPVPNLYMLGAATWPGHGVGGGSGNIVAQKLLSAP